MNRPASGLQAAAQDVPLPNTPDGFRMGTGPVVVDAFLDLLCPDCAGEWPTLQQLMAHYDPKTQLSFVLHTFPLPYHTFAFRVARECRGSQPFRAPPAQAGPAWR